MPADKLELANDEFAFYFSTDVGIEAGELGTFLKRAATVAKRAGTEIRVVGIEDGSLAVILKALAKKRIVQAYVKEFNEKPGTLTLAAIAAVAAITAAMKPTPSSPDALAKAGADVVQNHNVVNIQIITKNGATVVMDERTAVEVREAERRGARARPPSLPTPDVMMMIEDARERHIEGSVFEVNGELVFRPENFNYYVPIDMDRSEVFNLEPYRMYRVSGEIVVKRGGPHSIIIHSAHML